MLCCCVCRERRKNNEGRLLYVVDLLCFVGCLLAFFFLVFLNKQLFHFLSSSFVWIFPFSFFFFYFRSFLLIFCGPPHWKHVALLDQARVAFPLFRFFVLFCFLVKGFWWMTLIYLQIGFIGVDWFRDVSWTRSQGRWVSEWAKEREHGELGQMWKMVMFVS